MKYTALTPLKHNGKRLEEGATLHLDEGAATDRLVELGAIAPVRTTRGPVGAPKGAPSTPAQAEAESAQGEEPSPAPSEQPQTDAE